MNDATTTASDAQKPSEVAAPVAVGRASKRAVLVEPVPSRQELIASGEMTDPARVTSGTPTDAELLAAGYPAVIDPVVLIELLREALTVLTIYAEVAVPVASYRGQPLSAHAPRELVERIHRAIGG